MSTNVRFDEAMYVIKGSPTPPSADVVDSLLLLHVAIEMERNTRQTEQAMNANAIGRWHRIPFNLFLAIIRDDVMTCRISRSTPSTGGAFDTILNERTPSISSQSS